MAPPPSGRRRGHGTEGDLARARELREELRSAMLAHHDDVTDGRPRLDRVAAGLPLRLDFTGQAPRWRPVASGPEGALAAIVAAVADAVSDGSWNRLKACRRESCVYAFYDTSKNQSRAWCSMRVCGNREKVATYRSRQDLAKGGLR